MLLAVIVKPCLSSSGPNPVDLSGEVTNFTVVDEGAHSIILDFLYNSSTIDEMTVTITDGDVEKTGYVTLHDCNEVSLTYVTAVSQICQSLSIMSTLKNFS